MKHYKEPRNKELQLLALIGRNDFVLIQAIEVLLLEGYPIGELSAFSTYQEKDVFNNLIQFTSKNKITFRFSAPAGAGDFFTMDDYLSYEENCLRWFAQETLGRTAPLVFLGAGNNLMVASFQKSAQVFGAAGIFHILAQKGKEPKTLNEVRHAWKKRELLCINTGKEPGWPGAHWLAYDHRPVILQEKDWHRVLAHPKEYSLRNIIENRVKEMDHLIAEKRSEVDIPFPAIMLLPSSALEWLAQPLSNDSRDAQWIQRLPKTDLHCHLGGFATSGDELAAIRSAASTSMPPIIEMSPPSNWPKPLEPLSLERYMSLGDNNGSKLLQDRKALVAQCKALYAHFLRENVRYAEVRCSPANYRSEDLSAADVLNIIRDTFREEMQRAKGSKEDHPCHVNLIVIATRKKQLDDLSAISRHLALAITSSRIVYDPFDCQVVGVDLAGYESKETRPYYFREDFRGVHRCGLALTIHAGENDDAEGIWSAVFDLNARRLGHALHLYQSPELIKSVVDRKIGVEMCPYANYQIKGFCPMPGISTPYPLLQYLRHGVKVSVNTDNIGISDAGISENLLFLAELCPGITRMDILRLIRNGLETSFVSSEHRNWMISLFSASIISACMDRQDQD